ncbi:MAG TPA: hypothetical protein P5234_14330 [Thermoanaerobaculaceae bacterium]|nr:hypothetical protein [Thermoanaerobaculaceae bacterium]HRU10225.1 hypothetical protein [Thermoanaerobaculia bacterium]
MSKPIVAPVEWATNLVHLVGDYPGSNTKVSPGAGVVAAGLIPGDIFAPTAEELNDVWNLWTRYLIWVSDGTSNPIGDPSIVERDANGVVYAQQFEGYPDAGGIDLYGVRGRSFGNNAGVLGQSGASSHAGVRGENTGLGPGGRFDAGGNSDGSWNYGSGSGSGARGFGGTTGPGVRGLGGSGGGPGGRFVGQSGLADIELSPNATNYGIQLTPGATCTGGIYILGNGQDGIILYPSAANRGIFISGSQNVGVAAAFVQQTGAGDGLQITAAGLGDGHMLRLTPKVNASQRAPLVLDGSNGGPSNIVAGGFGYDRNAERFYCERKNTPERHYLWDGPSGLKPALYNVTTQVTNANAGVPTTAITKAINLGANESAWVVCRMDLGWTGVAGDVTVTVAFDGVQQYQRDIYISGGASDNDLVKAVWTWQGRATAVTTVTVTIARIAANTVWARFRSLVALETIRNGDWI